MANACPMLAMGSETSRGNDPGTRPQETASAGQETTQRCDAPPISTTRWCARVVRGRVHLAAGRVQELTILMKP